MSKSLNIKTVLFAAGLAAFSIPAMAQTAGGSAGGAAGGSAGGATVGGGANAGGAVQPGGANTAPGMNNTTGSVGSGQTQSRESVNTKCPEGQTLQAPAQASGKPTCK